MKILCLGAGFTSSYLAGNFSREHDVYFLTRDRSGAEKAGLRVYNPGEAGAPDLILDTVPALFDGDTPRQPPYYAEVDAILNALPETPLVHIGTTSVYPEGASSELPRDLPAYDEDTPANPGSERGGRRLRWEEYLRSHYPGLRVVRAGGIYGPGRSLALRFREGDFRRAQSGNRVVSRIHVHDLARLCIALGRADGAVAPNMIIGVDAEPSPNRVTFAFLEELLDIRIPGDWREGEYQGRFMRSRYALDMLGGEYRFRDFRSGFRHSLQAST